MKQKHSLSNSVVIMTLVETWLSLLLTAVLFFKHFTVPTFTHSGRKKIVFKSNFLKKLRFTLINNIRHFIVFILIHNYIDKRKTTFEIKIK